MKIKWFRKKNNSTRYEWVLPYLRSETRLTPNPYLWTRLRTLLMAPEKARTGFFTHTAGILRWALPLIFIITMTFGIYIGLELSNNLYRYTAPERGISPDAANPDMEMLPDNELERLIPPLNLDQQEE